MPKKRTISSGLGTVRPMNRRSSAERLTEVRASWLHGALDGIVPTVKLYYAPRSRASRVRWMLEEPKIPYEIVPVGIRSGERRPEKYKAIHPLGQVPALEYDKVRMFESQAICMFLAERHIEAGLAPSDSAGLVERAAYYQWCAFAIGSLDPAVLRLAYLRAAGRAPDDPALQDAVAQTERVFSVLDDRLNGRAYLLGESFSTADVLCGQIANWGRNLRGYVPYVHVLGWLKRLQRRAGWLRSLD